MSDTNETIADIAAEIRRGERMFWSLRDCAAYADRIEAAAERERQDAMKTALLAKCKVCEKVGPASAPGNAAVMREALVEILDRTNREKARDRDAALNGGILEIHDIANTALNQTKGE